MARRPLWYSMVSSLAAILILAAGCSEQTPTAVQLDPVTVSASAASVVKANVVRAAQAYAAGTHSAVIGPQGGTLDFGIGSITFPAGALSRPTRITASTDGATIAVEFGQHGMQFPSNAQPVLSFRTDEASNASIKYVDNDGYVLESLDTTIDEENGLVVAALSHFSRYCYGSE